jgi:Co/Zn/Cd efflux system component
MDADASSHYKLVTENMSLLESTEGMKSSQGPLYADARSQREQRTQNNVKILIIMCTLFAIFVAAEVLGSIASNSLSLLGDAAAMSVDVFTVKG